MRLISAHYAWDGSRGLVRNPLIHINDNHEIVEFVEMGKAYVEHAHTEFFNGLLVPGFVSAINFSTEAGLDQWIISMNHCFANGSFYVAIGSDNFQNYHFEETSRPKVFSVTPELMKHIVSEGVFSPFTEMKQHVNDYLNKDVVQILKKYLYQPWVDLGLSEEGGSFDLRRRPGILALSGINWQTRSVTADLSFRYIDIPY